MIGKFEELKSKIEKDNATNLYDLLSEIVGAYDTGTITCKEYIRLYELTNERNNSKEREFEVSSI